MAGEVFMQISEEDYKALLSYKFKLQALEIYGVDNWTCYEDAMEEAEQSFKEYWSSVEDLKL
jgi:IS1 family transposase